MKKLRVSFCFALVTLLLIGPVSAIEVSTNFKTARLLFRNLDSKNYKKVSARVKLIGRRCLNMTGRDVKKVSTRRGIRVQTFNLSVNGKGAQKGSMKFYKLSNQSLIKKKEGNKERNLLAMAQSGKLQISAIAGRFTNENKSILSSYNVGIDSAVIELHDHMSELEKLVENKQYSKCLTKVKNIVGGGLL